MAFCVLEVAVPPLAVFDYIFTSLEPERMKVAPNGKDLNTKGISQLAWAITLTSEPSPQGEFVGFVAQRGSKPRARMGFTSRRDLEKIGIYPVVPASWPPPPGSTNGALQFRLRVPERTTFYYALAVRVDNQVFYGDPKIYNDPEPIEKVSSRGAGQRP